MSQLPQSKSRGIPRIFLAAIVTGLTAVAVAETVVVRKSVTVTAEKDMLSAPVEKVPINSNLEVLSRDGSWVRVRTPAGKEGFVAKSQIANAASLDKVAGAGGASGADASLAGRGLTPKAEEYAKVKSFKTADAQLMVDWGDEIPIDDVQAFMDAGHVGPLKHRK